MTSASPMLRATRKVLTALSSSDDPLSAHDVADQTGLNPQTACRLLNRLQRAGYTVSDSGRASRNISGQIGRRFVVYKLTPQGVVHAERTKDPA